MADQRAQLLQLLRDRSITRGDFVLSSGRRSTYYVDARMSTMASSGLRLIGDLGLAEIEAAGWTPASIGGLTLGADPVAYAISRASVEKPTPIDAFTVRKEAKAHGTGKRIEGCFASGMSVVVVEDVITTGGSALKAIEAIEAEGGKVVGVLAVVDRQEGGREAIESAGYSVRALAGLSDLDAL